MTLPVTIQEVEPFASFSEPAIARLGEIVQLRQFSEGDRVYAAGEEADGLYVLVSGTVDLRDPNTDAVDLGELDSISSAGALVSKGSILHEFEHRHDVVALEDSELLFLSREIFQREFEAQSEFTFQLLDYLVRELVEEVRELNQLINELVAD